MLPVRARDPHAPEFQRTDAQPREYPLRPRRQSARACDCAGTLSPYNFHPDFTQARGVSVPECALTASARPGNSPVLLGLRQPQGVWSGRFNHFSLRCRLLCNSTANVADAIAGPNNSVGERTGVRSPATRLGAAATSPWMEQVRGADDAEAGHMTLAASVTVPDSGTRAEHLG